MSVMQQCRLPETRPRCNRLSDVPSAVGDMAERRYRKRGRISIRGEVVILRFAFVIFGFWSLIIGAAVMNGAVAQEGARIEVVLRMEHSGSVNSVAFSPDGKTVLSGSYDHTLKLWDVATGYEIRTLVGHSGEVTSVAFSPDGKTALSASADATLKLWDIETGRQIKTLAGHSGSVNSIAFSPDGKSALSGGDDYTLRLWDLTKGHEVGTFSGHSGGVTCVAFSPNGRRALSGSWDKMLKLWDLTTGREIRNFTAHSNRITSVAFSPDGENAISTSWDGAIKLWDIATGHEIRSFAGHVGGTNSATFSADGKTVLSGGWDSTLRLWDAATGREIRSFAGQTGGILSVGFSPDGRIALTGNFDDTLKFWDLTTGRETLRFPRLSDQIIAIAISPDGRSALFGGWDNTLRHWDVSAGREIRNIEAHSGGVNAVTFSPDGKTALSGSDDATVKHWDLTTGHQLQSFGGHSSGVWSVAFSPNDQTALSGSSDSTLRLWDVTTGREIRRFVGHSDTVTSVAFLKGSVTAISGSSDKTLKLWNVATGQLIRTFRGHSDGVTAVGLLPNGKMALSASEDKTLRLWDLATGRVIRSFRGHSDGVTTLAISSDGRNAISGSRDNTLKLWNVATGKEIRTYTGHSDWIRSVAFSPDGKTALSGGGDGTTRLWDVRRGVELGRLMSSPDSDWLTMMPPAAGGFFNASSVKSDLLAVVRGLEVTGINQLYQSLFSPDLVREKLAGDPDHEVDKAAKELNLEKVLDSGRPPEVSIVTAATALEVNADVVTAEGKITDDGGGIGRIEWRVNGLTVGVETPPQNAPKILLVSRTLPLDPGQNTIELTAYNARNLLASVPATISVASTASSGYVKPKLHAIVFGLNNYGGTGLRSLHYALPDAVAVGTALKQAGKDLYEGGVEVTYVLDPGTPSKGLGRVFDATAEGLEKAFGAVGQQTDVHDTFVFFAAGHGKAVDGRFHLVTKDFHFEGDIDTSMMKHAVSQDKLQDLIVNKIKAKRGLILLDTCESGASVVGSTRNDAEAALGKLHEATGRPVITASSADQSALEGYKGHGVFTWALLDALVNGDINSNGTIEVSEIAAHVQTLTPTLTAELQEKRSRLALGYANEGYDQRAAITTNPNQISSNARLSAQKPRTGSRGEDFPLVKRLAVWPAVSPAQ